MRARVRARVSDERSQVGKYCCLFRSNSRIKTSHVTDFLDSVADLEVPNFLPIIPKFMAHTLLFPVVVTDITFHNS